MKRILYSSMLVVALGACGRGDATVQGNFADADPDVADIWVVGREGKEPLAGGQFDLRAVPAGTVDLRFGDADGEAARILVLDLPGGASLTLHDISVDRRGLALPGWIDLDGADVVTINGIRMARPDRLPRRIATDAVVLAGSADALLVRPADERLPDLRVVVTPATRTSTPDGDPAELGTLEQGDSVRVEGTTDRGYVVAAALVVPRASATRARPPSGGRSAPASAPAAGSRTATPAAAGRASPSAPRDEARRGPPHVPPGHGGERRGRGRGRDD